MDQQRFDRMTAALSSGTGRRRAIAGLLGGTTAILGQRATTTARKRKKTCTHCPQRACCSCTADNYQTASKCIPLETPNADITLTVASALCDEFCTGPGELVFGVNDNLAGSANFCRADNTCGVKQCPIKLQA